MPFTYGSSNLFSSGSRKINVTIGHRYAISLSVHLHRESFRFGIIQRRFIPFCTAFFNISQEIFFRLTAFICLILCRMHGIFKEFLFVLAKFPFILFHHLAVLVQRVRIVVLRISGEEFTSFTFSLFYQFGSQRTRQLTCLAQQHIPDVIGNHPPTFLTFLHSDDIHHGKVLNILAERGHQRWITHTGPNVCHFVEQLDKQLVLRHKRQITFCLILIDRFQIGLQVSHQATHHTTRKSRTYQQGIHQAISRADVKSEEVIHKLLNKSTDFHIGFHIDFRHLETGVFQHSLYTEQVSMSRTP